MERKIYMIVLLLQRFCSVTRSAKDTASRGGGEAQNCYVQGRQSERFTDENIKRALTKYHLNLP